MERTGRAGPDPLHRTSAHDPGFAQLLRLSLDTAPATIEVNRQLLHLPDDAIVFFSGANYFETLPELSSAWAAILAAVPGSYLVLMPYNPNWSNQYDAKRLVTSIEAQLRQHGVDPERLRIVSSLPERADVQRVIATADVYLDSYPFSGACSLVEYRSRLAFPSSPGRVAPRAPSTATPCCGRFQSKSLQPPARIST